MTSSFSTLLRCAFLSAVFIGLSTFAPATVGDPAFERIYKQAEDLRAEGSHALAGEQFRRALVHWEALGDEAEAREPWMHKRLEFLIEDCRWRELQGSGREAWPDLSAAHRALGNLAERVREAAPERPPALYAEIFFSMGELQLRGWEQPRWRSAWNYFREALEWWAESTDLEAARQAYLRHVERITELARTAGRGYGDSLRSIPLPVVEDYLRLAETEEEQSFGLFVLARALDMQGHDPRLRLRIAEAYQESIAWAESTDSAWLDEALYWYALWAEHQGRLYFDDSGQLVAEPNYEEAVAHYEKLIERFSAETSPHFEAAREALNAIREEHLSVAIAHTYLPESEVSFRVRARNVETVEVAIHPVDLNRDVNLSAYRAKDASWMDFVEKRQIAPWKRYTFTPAPAQAYGHWDHQLRVEVIPEPGAYLVVARAGELRAVDLLLVTGKTLVLKTGGSRTLAFFADALTGEPVGEAEVVIREATLSGGDDPVWTWREQRGQTDSSGLVQFAFSGGEGQRALLATARRGAQQALVYAGGRFWPEQGNRRLVYVYSDRSLYRPGDTVHWKAITRIRRGAGYETPAGATLNYEIVDPRGQVVKSGSTPVNEFGSSWGELTLPTGREAVLGLYSIAFTLDGEEVETGRATLFRVEEARLPAYEVSIAARGQEQDRQNLFQLGDRVMVEVQVDFLAGGAVVDAEVEILIREQPFFRPQPLPRFDRREVPRRWMQPARVVSRQVLRTDGRGQVRFPLPEPGLRQQDLEYQIEARVRDATGAEVSGTETIRMTRQPYFVELTPEFQLYKPGDEARIRVRAVNANEEPMEVAGRLELVRLVWEEIWIDPRGRQISGEEYHGMRQRRGFFGIGSAPRNFRLLRRGYQLRTIAEADLETGADGVAVFARRIAQEGYYQVRWLSRDGTLIPIKSETSFFVADAASNDIGYHHGGLSLLVDHKQVVPGQPTPILITSPVSNRWVLLVTGDEEPSSAMAVRMDGTVKLLNLTFSEEQAPATFVEASMVAELQLYQVRERVEIPPRQKEIQLELTPEADSFLPGQRSSWLVRTTDTQGRPVEAEVSLALVDDAGFQIQPDLAESPLAFFHERERPFQISTESSFRWKRYLDNRPVADGESLPTAPPQPLVDDFTREDSEMAVERTMTMSAFEAPETVRRLDAPEPPPGAAPLRADAPEVALRRHFHPALFWAPALKTDINGEARLEIPFSDSLTRWRATARAVGSNHRFGEARQTVQTRLPLVARLPVPRFLIDGDSWELGAVIQNNEAYTLQVIAELQASGAELLTGSDDARRILTAEGGAQVRVPWKMHTQGPGEILFEFSARTDEYGDRVEMRVPVREHGLHQIANASGATRKQEWERTLDIPGERNEELTSVEIVVAPDLAWVLHQGLETLMQGDDATSEMIASRLLATLTLYRAWRERGLASDAFYRMLPGLSGMADADARRRAWVRWVRAQVSVLQEFQEADGAVVWRRQGIPDVYMTAYTVWALTIVDQEGLLEDREGLTRGRAFLRSRLRMAEHHLSEQVWILHALATRFERAGRGRPEPIEIESFSNLWRSRDALESFGTALLTTISRSFQFEEETAILHRNLRNGLTESTSADGQPMAYWPSSVRSWRQAHTRVETTSLALRALAGQPEERELKEAIHLWLIRNQTGAAWHNSRESALALVGLSAFLHFETGRLNDQDFAVHWNGIPLTPETDGGMLRFHLGPAAVETGKNTLGLVRPREGSPVYYRATVRYFTHEKPIPASGDILRVNRQYHHLRPTPTLLRGVKEERMPVQSEHYLIGRNQRLEVLIRLEADQGTPYLVVEDTLPAGFESTRVLSGDTIMLEPVSETGAGERRARVRENARSLAVAPTATMEVRDGRMLFFLDSLPAGTWELRYALRAETPGRFHALPATARAKYLPEAEGNSGEVILQVTE